jgi:hypothetical protein
LDEDDDHLKVSFYAAEAGGEMELIGIENIETDTPPIEGDISVPWVEKSYGVKYSWYAVADDGKVQVQSPVWEFTVENEAPSEPQNPGTEEGDIGCAGTSRQ